MLRDNYTRYVTNEHKSLHEATKHKYSQTIERISANDTQQRLIDHPKRRHNWLVLRLADELGENSDVLHGPLSIGNTHGTVQEVDRPKPTRVVQAVLRTGYSVQFEVHA